MTTRRGTYRYRDLVGTEQCDSSPTGPSGPRRTLSTASHTHPETRPFTPQKHKRGQEQSTNQKTDRTHKNRTKQTNQEKHLPHIISLMLRLSACKAAQAAIRPSRMCMRHIIENIATVATGGPARPTYWAWPYFDHKPVGIGFFYCCRVPLAGAEGQITIALFVFASRVKTGNTIRGARRVLHQEIMSSTNAPPREGVAFRVSDCGFWWVKL